MPTEDISRLLYFQTLARQNLDRELKKQAGPTQNSAFEPYQRPVPNIGTIRTDTEWALYAAESGSREAHIALWLLRSSKPELSIYIPEYNVAKESMLLAESQRDQSGFVHQTKPETTPLKHKPQEKGHYKLNPYSYTPYSKAAYLKSASKKVYSGIEEEVKKLFGRIRSVYQSSSGVIRNRKRYEGKNEVPKNDVVSLDTYRQIAEKRKYIPPQATNLEERVAA